MKDEAEVRVVSPTGGAKGAKMAQLGALDPDALWEVARVAGFGGEKYSRYNFLRGYNWSLSFDALCRHALAFWAGEDTDGESEMSHLAHAAWHCLALLAFINHGLGTDDRPHRFREKAELQWMKGVDDESLAAIPADAQRARRYGVDVPGREHA